MQGKGDDLVAAAFDGAGLVHADMSAFSGNDALPGLQHGGENQGICLRAADKKENVGPGGAAGGTDLFAG